LGKVWQEYPNYELEMAERLM